MLSFFRGSGVAQTVGFAIVATVIVAFVVEFRAGRGPTAGLKRHCAVEYAHNCVDQKDYFAAYGLVGRGIGPGAAKRFGLRKKVLEGLAERELLVAKARSLDLGVGQDTIDAELERGRAHVSLPASTASQDSAQLGLCRIDPSESGCEVGAERMVRQFHLRRSQNEAFDYKLYEREIRVLANRGPREFKEMQERELLAERLRSLVRSRVRVSDAEVNAVAEHAVIRSAILSRDWFAKYIVDMTPSAVDKWAFENRAEVDRAWNSDKPNWTAGCPAVREIVVPLPPMALDSEGSPARKKAEDARARLAAGESFASVARDVSSGPSALLGGEVGCLSKAYGLGAEELLKAVEGLKLGALSDVIDTPRGFHVVEVVDKLDAAKLEETGRKHAALGLYVHFAADEAAHKFAAALIERVKSGQKLEDSVRELNEDTVRSARPNQPKTINSNSTTEAEALAASDRPRFEISAPFERAGNPLPDLEPKESVSALAFELTKPDALYEKPVETETGLVVFQLKERVLPDAQRTAAVRGSLLQSKGDDAITAYVAELRHAAGKKLIVDASFGEDSSQASDDE